MQVKKFSCGGGTVSLLVSSIETRPKLTASRDGNNQKRLNSFDIHLSVLCLVCENIRHRFVEGNLSTTVITGWT